MRQALIGQPSPRGRALPPRGERRPSLLPRGEGGAKRRMRASPTARGRHDTHPRLAFIFAAALALVVAAASARPSHGSATRQASARSILPPRARARRLSSIATAGCSGPSLCPMGAGVCRRPRMTSIRAISRCSSPMRMAGFMSTTASTFARSFAPARNG